MDDDLGEPNEGSCSCLIEDVNFLKYNKELIGDAEMHLDKVEY
jgi:hypothetical protein